MRSLAIFLTGLLLNGCFQNPSEEESSFHPYSNLNELKDERLLSLKKDFDLLQPPSIPSGIAFDSSWMFKLGDAAEGLNTISKEIEGIEVHLPHRELFPNHPFWYFKRIHFQDSGFLHISADDGAQLYVNGKRIKQISPNTFPLDSGGADLAIRVLNNAMKGGLQHVKFLTLNQFQEYQQRNKRYIVKHHLIKKVLLSRAIDTDLIELAQKMITQEDVDQEVEILQDAFANLPYLIGPYLRRESNGNLNVRIFTDSDLPIALRWGVSPHALDNIMSANGSVADFTFHENQIDTIVYYQVFSGESFSPLFTIDTRPRDSISFNVWADSQSGWTAFSKTMKIISRGHYDFGIGIGDLVANGSDSIHWIKFMEILSTSAAQVPYYLIPGNHDYDGYYEDLYPVNYYRFTGNTKNYQSWTSGNAAFIAIDPNENFPIGIQPASEQHQWFSDQLHSESWNKATWRFVMLHQPPFSQGWEGYHGDSIIRDLLEPVMENAKIDFVLSGHTHDYERLSRMYGNQKVTFLILGGAGGGLEPLESSEFPKMDTVVKVHHVGRFTIDGSRLLFKATDHDGVEIDSYNQIKHQ